MMRYAREAASFQEAPPSRSLPKKWVLGRFWGRGRFSERSASPPDPLSRRADGVRVGTVLLAGFRLKAERVSEKPLAYGGCSPLDLRREGGGFSSRSALAVKI